jgi:hypothetical protein
MLPQTRFLSRMLGIYCLLIGLFIVTHRERVWETVNALAADRPLVFVLSIVMVFGGLAMLLVHNIWSGGALTVIVTLLCWATLLKGVLLLYLSPDMLVAFYAKQAHYSELLLADGAAALVLGLYLTWKGFEAERR